VSNEGEEDVASVDCGMREKEFNDGDRADEGRIDIEMEIIIVEKKFSETTDRERERRVDTRAAP